MKKNSIESCFHWKRLDLRKVIFFFLLSKHKPLCWIHKALHLFTTCAMIHFGYLLNTALKHHWLHLKTKSISLKCLRPYFYKFLSHENQFLDQERLDRKFLSPYSARLVKTERRKIFRVIESDLAPVVLCREKKQKESRTPLTQDLWDIARLDDSIHNT